MSHIIHDPTGETCIYRFLFRLFEHKLHLPISFTAPQIKTVFGMEYYDRIDVFLSIETVFGRDNRKVKIIKGNVFYCI